MVECTVVFKGPVFKGAVVRLSAQAGFEDLRLFFTVAFQKVAKVMNFEIGDVILHEKEAPRGIFLIVSGVVKVKVKRCCSAALL